VPFQIIRESIRLGIRLELIGACEPGFDFGCNCRESGVPTRNLLAKSRSRGAATMDCGSHAAALARPALLAVERASGFNSAQYAAAESPDFGAAGESGFLTWQQGCPTSKRQQGCRIPKRLRRYSKRV